MMDKRDSNNGDNQGGNEQNIIFTAHKTIVLLGWIICLLTIPQCFLFVLSLSAGPLGTTLFWAPWPLALILLLCSLPTFAGDNKSGWKFLNGAAIIIILSACIALGYCVGTVWSVAIMESVKAPGSRLQLFPPVFHLLGICLFLCLFVLSWSLRSLLLQGAVANAFCEESKVWQNTKLLGIACFLVMLLAFCLTLLLVI
jgi:hypothetical protein